MWRTPTPRKGQQFIKVARKLATESATPKQNVPPRIPQQPSNSTGVRTLKFIGLSLPVIAGSIVGYAWYDSDFRKQIEDNIPYARELFENILPKSEEKVPVARKKSPESSFEKASIPNAQQETAKLAPLRTVSRKADDNLPEKGITTSLKETASEKRSSKISSSDAGTQRERKEDEEKSDNAALEVVIHKLTTNSQNVITETVKAQMEVAGCIRNQTKLLKIAMDDASDVLMKDAQWEAVTVACKERELAMTRANELLAESKKSVEKLRDILQEGRNNRVTQNNPAIIPATKKLNDFLKDLGNATLQVRQAEAESSVVHKYKDLVEKGRKQFQKEVESLIPSVKFGTGKKLSEDELNALIVHAHRRIEQLQKQIAEQLAMERQRLSIALEAQRHGDIKLANSALAEEHQYLQKQFEAEKSKMDFEYLEKLETEVRKQLARQAGAHSDHLRDALAAQQQALSVDFTRKVQTKVLEERERFQLEVASWISRLKGIEAAVEARATSEKLTRCAQDLWLACIALNSAIHTSDDSDKHSKPLKTNIDLILEAGQKHPFVETIVRAFPQTALVRGVNTEDEMRRRFYRVSNICRRLGLVDASNTSVYRYLISYLHSFVVLDNVVATLAGQDIDLTSLDNFDLLSHANYWMEKDNLDIALRFMIQLTGESRRAASDWIVEAQLLLETKQIANTLMAYASATGLANTF